ncbi:hypothetical protein [Lentiprolixibacter aurantiacus]|uniref:Uncharacterized protein n=1 Tax=Lentiprolixibacter aurantiacus TaxID=2993939 RepID=A0AAE3MLN5_9FLAO|nr:hypothetical protein [Lentiprolixibacter aurantiacus]MCX2719718.1 hypothetical protein [Lentiprolixibacter aurantiacus]
MARETCVACRGTGRGSGVGGDCVVCNGMGTIWVPGNPKPGPIGGPGPGTSGSESFEDWAASMLGLASWGIVTYYGVTGTDLEWYWPLIGGVLAGLFVVWLFKGPLRFLLILAKYILFIGGLAWGIYLIYLVVKAFSEA